MLAASDSVEPVLVADHLQKRYGNHVAVADVSLVVSAGEILGLLGPNGAGKSTTMMMLAGLLTPDGGSLSLAGQPFRPDQLSQRRLLGVVPQDLAVYPDLSAAENLRFFGQLYGLSGKLLAERVDAVLHETGLSDQASDNVLTFSGGMKRRLNYGIAIMHQPQVLILDEPTVGVDPQSRAHLLASVQKLADNGTGVIYASHYMEEVQAICQRVAIVDHGRMLASGRIRDLLRGLATNLYLHFDAAEQSTVEAIKAAVETAFPGVATVRTSAHEGQASVDTGSAVVIASSESGLATRVAGVLQLLSDRQVNVTRIETQETNLERLFLDLTGRRLRE